MNKNVSKVGQALLFLVGIYLLFNLVFFLGTTPTKAIDLLFQKIIAFTWVNVKNESFRDFLVYGLLTAIGGFLVYVPNIVFLFFFSNLFQHSGITNWAAKFMDPFFRKFGLNGYSFPPLLFGFGCSVNAVQSAGDIQDKKRRLITMLIAPFMSCGAKFAVYMLLISVVFPVHKAGSVLFVLYMIGILFALVSATIFRFVFRVSKESAPTIFPNDPIRKPDMKAVFLKTAKDTKVFLLKAGSVIVGVSIVIWALSSFPGITPQEYKSMTAKAEAMGQPIPSRTTLSLHTSYIKEFGAFVEPIFKPMGQDWKSGIALLNSFVGNGVVISTLVTLYGIEFTPESPQVLARALKVDPNFTTASALSMMLFVLLSGSCLASIMMFYNDRKSIPLTALFSLYPFVSAYFICVAFYQVVCRVVS